MVPQRISYTHQPRTVDDLVSLYEKDQLNLEPGFQRQSVWTEKDRRKLIDSVLRGYPLPAIFLYRREDDGRIVYDVFGKRPFGDLLDSDVVVGPVTTTI